MKRGRDRWEECPKCGSISIEWRADRSSFRCLNRACQNEWQKWPGGPKTYNEIKNKYLKVSLSRLSPIPFASVK